MIKVPVIDKEGKVVGKEELDEQLLGGYVRRSLLKQVVLMYENNQHMGLSSTKTRGEVKGSTKKKWRQKGTGRARVGAGKVPHFRGGGIAHGPVPREISYTLPKKARKKALKSALLAKFKDGSVQILDKLEMEKPKTKEMDELLKKASLQRSCLFVLDRYDRNALLSSRNIPFLQLLPLADLNAHMVLKKMNILFTKASFDAMKESFGKKKEEATEEEKD